MIVNPIIAGKKSPVIEDISATYELSGNFYMYTITVSQEVDTFLGLGAYTANKFGFAYPYAASSDSNIGVVEFISNGWMSCTFAVSGNTIAIRAPIALGDPGAISSGKVCYLPK